MYVWNIQIQVKKMIQMIEQKRMENVRLLRNKKKAKASKIFQNPREDCTGSPASYMENIQGILKKIYQ